MTEKPWRSLRYIQNRYVTPSGEASHEMAETRAFSGKLGQITEDVCTRCIPGIDFVTPEQHGLLVEYLNALVPGLREKILAIKVPEGKTLSHKQIYPLYAQAYESNALDIVGLSYMIDQIHGTEFVGMFKEKASLETIKNYKSELEQRYLLDAILICAKLTAFGLGEDITFFGNLVTDVNLRNKGNSNKSVVQFDAMFVSQKINSPIEKEEEREQLIRNLAGENRGQYYIDSPPILRIPALVEIKTHFRPRFTAYDLSRDIPPYMFRQMILRIGESLINADIGVVPVNAVFIRLRSLGPNTIYIKSLGREFYASMIDQILELPEETSDPELAKERETLRGLVGLFSARLAEIDNQSEHKSSFDGKGQQDDLFPVTEVAQTTEKSSNKKVRRRKSKPEKDPSSLLIPPGLEKKNEEISEVFSKYSPFPIVSVEYNDLPKAAIKVFEGYSERFILPESYKTKNFHRYWKVDRGDNVTSWITWQTKIMPTGLPETTIYLCDVSPDNQEIGRAELIYHYDHKERGVIKKPLIGWNSTEEKYIKKGFGTQRLILINAISMALFGMPANSEVHFISPPNDKHVSEGNLWEHLKTHGLAKKYKNRYSFSSDANAYKSYFSKNNFPT